MSGLLRSKEKEMSAAVENQPSLVSMQSDRKACRDLNGRNNNIYPPNKRLIEHGEHTLLDESRSRLLLAHLYACPSAVQEQIHQLLSSFDLLPGRNRIQ